MSGLLVPPGARGISTTVGAHYSPQRLSQFKRRLPNHESSCCRIGLIEGERQFLIVEPPFHTRDDRLTRSGIEGGERGLVALQGGGLPSSPE